MGRERLAQRMLLLALAIAASACGSVHAYPFEKPVRVDGDALEVTVVVNPCTTVESIDVEEDAQRITLTAVVRQEGGSCNDMGVPVTRQVLLQAPVGDREIVDGACSIQKYQSYSYCNGG